MRSVAELSACVHRPPCPGCPRFGQHGIPDEALARLRQLALAHGGAEVVVHSMAAAGYRTRARLAVRGSALRPQIGIFAEGTHQVVDIPHCGVQHPLINEVAIALGRSIAATGATTYSERTHRGLVRYLQVVVERSSNTAQVVVVCNSERSDPAERLFEQLTSELGAALHSLFFNAQSERKNHILGPATLRVRGPHAVSERLGGAVVYFPPDAFGQANLGGFEQILSRIHEHVDPAERVVEFYGGVGAIGLGLLNRGNEVAINEVSPGSLRGLDLGLLALEPAARGRARVVPGRAEEAMGALELGGAHVIVDPPRKGLDPRLVQRFVEADVRAITYLSCGLPALLRDVELLAAGGFTCRAIDAYALFPFTEHVETLVALRR